MTNVDGAQLSAEASLAEAVLEGQQQLRSALVVLQQAVSPLVILLLPNRTAHLHQALPAAHHYPCVLEISVTYVQLGLVGLAAARLLAPHLLII